ncbi:conserved hypothetical protein [Thiomonas arsenitoxydans]|uniref:Uncharacterized protein n=1 Tax=Thiomonas arsenitoxydans (strain DSM 22701 / CIP 110005 / 3As) TaxID=426114 RepID=D6CSX6_THIA3|nr:hypothetical protein THI_1722 [Thiomonas arsenitoxydans]CQR33465.1 conserved hypothetical protein [Thiomonas arsenitoxydans]CQR33742.1 conserved hypothetical protein [Thiomonas arsenitoxydans]
MAVRLHEQLPLNPAAPCGMLMMVLLRQRMPLRNANLVPAHNATIDAGVRRNDAGRVFLIECVVTVLAEVDCIFEGCHRGFHRC